jgi:radical SAM enzyme (TIGR01210 family)
MDVKTYLLLKPPFLTERDAISDVVDSIKKLKQSGFTDSISINPVNIQKFTLIEYLFDRKDYRPPWLWSVIRVLENGHEILDGSKIRLLSAPTGGGHRNGAHNCGKCDTSCLEAINDYSLNNDPGIFKDISCSCYELWLDLIDLENAARTRLDWY